MSRTYKDMPLRVHGKRRQEIDARRLARAVISMAEASEEAEQTTKSSTAKRQAKRPKGTAR